MKITHVDTFVVGTEWRNLTIIRAHTDEGLTGLGEARMVNHTDALVGVPGRGGPEASRRARPVQDEGWSRRWAATTSRAPAR